MLIKTLSFVFNQLQPKMGGGIDFSAEGLKIWPQQTSTNGHCSAIYHAFAHYGIYCGALKFKFHVH